MTKWFFVAFTLSAAACLLPLRATAGPHLHWSYEGEAGPEHWGELAPEFSQCKAGHAQTPIDLRNAHIHSELADLKLAYVPVAAEVVNNGHTVQVDLKPGNLLQLGDSRYQLAQFHFHHPSEHTLNGHRFPLELHLVHKDATGRLAVMGVFLQEGNAHPTLDTIWGAMPQQPDEKRALPEKLSPITLLPPARSYLTYPGSLTTPPCSEGIRWLILAEPVSVSQAQIDQFAKLYPHNNRPLQAIGARELQQLP